MVTPACRLGNFLTKDGPKQAREEHSAASLYLSPLFRQAHAHSAPRDQAPLSATRSIVRLLYLLM